MTDRSVLPRRWPGPGRQTLLAVAGIAALSAFAALVAVLYVGAEHWVYYWDNANFQDLTTRLREAVERSRTGALRLVGRSLGDEYNLLFAVPLVPWTLLFGDSRTAFITGLVALYLVPFALATGYLMRGLVKERRGSAFWFGAGTVLLFGSSWIPVLRGYPDVGGAALLTLAAAIFIRDPRLRDARRLVLIAGLIAAALVFRRTFADASLALLASMAIWVLVPGLRGVRRDPRQLLSEVAGPGLRLVAVAVLALAGLWVLARPALESIVATSLSDLYASYRLPAGDVLAFFWTWLGPLAWVIAVLGLMAGLWGSGTDHRAVAFVGTFGLAAMLAWTLATGQTNGHYAYQFMPAIVAGIALGAHRIHGLIVRDGDHRGGPPMRRLLGPLSLAAMSVAGLATLWLTLAAPSLTMSPIAALLPTPLGPAVRTDLGELDRLIAYLRTTAPGRPTYVVASSFFFNSEIVRQGERQRADPPPRITVMTQPDIDSRDFYPVTNLALAEVVLLAEPFQHHLRPEEQRVVQAGFDAFIDGWPISREFQRQPESFRLEFGIQVSAFRRTAPSSPSVVYDTLRRVREVVGRVPGAQPSWVAVRAPQGALSIHRGTDGEIVAATLPVEASASSPSAIVLSDQAAAVVRGRVRFGSAACESLELRSQAHAGDGSVLAEDRRSLRPSDTPDFELNVSGRSHAFVTLALRVFGDRRGGTTCPVTLEALTLATS